MVRASVSQNTYENLRESILQRKLVPGTILQEEQLAQRLGVSRTPVREALSKLASEGLVTHSKGSTPMVRRLSVDEFIEVLYIRRLLEVEAAGRAATNPDVVDLLALRVRVAGLLEGDRPTPVEHMQLDNSLHGTVARMAGSQLLSSMIEELRMKTHIFDMGRIPERFLPGAHEHLEIVDSIVAQDVERAQQAMRTHIERVRESIVNSLQRLFETE